MLIYSDCLAVFKLPAADATTGALGTIAAAYFPIVRRCLALKNNFAHGQIVGIVTLPFSPVRKDDF